MFIIIPYRVDEAGWKFGGAERDKGKRLRCLREGRKKRDIGVTRVTNFAFCTLSLSLSLARWQMVSAIAPLPNTPRWVERDLDAE